MSAEVVTIRGQVCRRRKNRREDEEAIHLRRLLSTFEETVFEEENATALALSWAMERKLPCRRLRLIAGTLDQQLDHSVRLQDVEIARAEREASDAKRLRTRLLYGAEAADEMHSDGERLFQRYRQAVSDLANTPALTRQDIDRKKRAVGTVWLKAEGAWYDRLRAAVAEDEARLSASKHGRW